MRWIRKLISPNYDEHLPYSYEARIEVAGWNDAYQSYFSDTICGLITFLDKENISPDQVSLFEIFHDQKLPIESRICAHSNNIWQSRKELCSSLKHTYKGHHENGKCAFHHRESGTRGPQRILIRANNQQVPGIYNH